jgi:hypothetical protein
MPVGMDRSNAAPTSSTCPDPGPCWGLAGAVLVEATTNGRPATAATSRKAPKPCSPYRPRRIERARGRFIRPVVSPDNDRKRYGFPLDPTATVGTLPFAYRQMTEIAKALIGDVRILILDEHRAVAAEARIKISTWIVDFYNLRRRHSTCDGMSPIDYERLMAEAREGKAA